MTGEPELLEVRLIGVPVSVWSRSNQHFEELMREFTLIAQQLAEHDDPAHVPQRLIDLVQRLTAEYSAFGEPQEDRLRAAAEANEEAVDLVYRMPRSVVGAAVELGNLLDEADAYCRAGQHLLTLATPEDCVRLRWWYLDQFIDQAAGRPPVPWPDYVYQPGPRSAT
jgi:hypothetical protein